MRISAFVSVLTVAVAAGLSFPSHPSHAQQKTVKACQQEWRANKAANQAKGISEKAYVEQCRAGATGGTAAAPPPPASNETASKPAQPSERRTTTGRANPAADEYGTEAQAKAHCPGQTVVWANLHSHVYHFAGTRNYGHTKSGAYMCETDANKAGMRAAKNEKHE